VNLDLVLVPMGSQTAPGERNKKEKKQCSVTSCCIVESKRAIEDKATGSRRRMEAKRLNSNV
jgi:hypothetical protein